MATFQQFILKLLFQPWASRQEAHCLIQDQHVQSLHSFYTLLRLRPSLAGLMGPFSACSSVLSQALHGLFS